MESVRRLDLIFFALSDSRRRAILKNLSDGEQTVGALAKNFDMTLGAVSKHINHLQRADLISKSKRGKQVWCRMNEDIWKEITAYISMYESFWSNRFQELEGFINQ